MTTFTVHTCIFLQEELDDLKFAVECCIVKSPHPTGVNGGSEVGDDGLSGVQQLVEEATGPGTATGNLAVPLPHLRKVSMFYEL